MVGTAGPNGGNIKIEDLGIQFIQGFMLQGSCLARSLPGHARLERAGRNTELSRDRATTVLEPGNAKREKKRRQHDGEDHIEPIARAGGSDVVLLNGGQCAFYPLQISIS